MLIRVGSFMGAAKGSGEAGSAASALLSRWADANGGLAIDFTDLSMVITDPVTSANNFNGNPNSKLAITSDPKWILNSSGVYVQTSANTLATEYDGSGTALGVRIEEARTNSALWSEEITDASWTKTATTATGNTSTAPDGNTTADTLADTVASTFHALERSIASVTSGTTYCWSQFVKAGTDTRIQLTFASGTFSGVGYANFDLSAGTVSATGGTLVASGIIPYPNGWYRCWIAAAATASAGSIAFAVRINNGSAARAASYAGTGTTVLVWGAQFEAGSFPTSYIPTTTAAVTRNADNVSLATSLFPYSATEGTLFAKSRPAVRSGALQNAVAIDDGTSNERLIIRPMRSTLAQFAVVSSASTQAQISFSSAAAGVQTKLAGVYAANDFQAAYDGVLGTADASGTVPTVTTMRIGHQAGPSEILNGHIAQIMHLPRRMSNADMQALTT